MKKKISPRWSAAVLVCLGFGLLVSLNYCASRLTGFLGLRFDMTGSHLYELSDETLEILGRSDEHIRIRVFSSESDFLPLVAEILEQYRLRGKGRIEVEYIDPYVQPTLLDSYIQRGYQLELGSIVVESERYTKVLSLKDMFELDSSGNTVRGIKSEQQITSAILYASGTDALSVQFTAGHNEAVSDSLKELFSQSNYETGNAALSMESVEPGTDLLVIASPTSDFSEQEITALDAYMSDGGRLLAFMGPSSGDMPNLESFFAEWGIGITRIVVAEELQYTDANPLSIVPVYAAHPVNQYFAGNQLYLVMPSSRALEQLFVSQGGIRTQKLLYSTARAYDSQDKDGEKGPFTLAMTAEKKKDEGKARLVLIGSSGLYSDSFMTADNFANAKFLAQVLNWCTETDSAVNIPAKNIGSTQITVTGGQVILQALVFVVILPVGVLLAGFFVCHRRRHS